MTTKAGHYLDQLDEARCDGNWDAVPELVRKIRKHAKDRTCLTLAAETECAIAKMTAAAARPSTSNTARDLDVSDRLPKLLSAIEEEVHHAEDRFQARVCVGWLHWIVAEYSLALARLPKSLDEQVPQLEPAESVSEWTNVCALKGAYLRANCFMRDGQRAQALFAYRSGLPSLARVWSGQGVRKQLRYWSELFLTEYCQLSSQALSNSELSLEDPSAIACFRSWARYWEVMSAPVTGGYGFKGASPRRRIWNEYYLALSRILENDLPYITGHLEKFPSDSSPRSQLRMELKQAETAYQSLLLSETSFPRADEEREEVEAFIKQLMRNWSILCGRGWRDQDLGQGGRGSISRGVLDILYSAATKTYHSTAILRSLFSVHLSLAEFELAFKAFNSYLEIVNKGKARVAKTGRFEPSLDDDGTVLETMARGVMAMCRYGHKPAAEKARQLGAELEDWLSKLPQTKGSENGTLSLVEAESVGDLRVPVAPHIIALAWQAIGISHAHWSRVTHEAGSRTEIQSKAMRSLRRSLAPEFGRSKDIRTFFGLGLLLAERRELTSAIEVVKAALISSKGQEEDYSLQGGPYWQERSLIPMWHLLALLMSARQDYALAMRACEGALEQFKDDAVLFGRSDASFRSEHLKETEAKGPTSESRRGLVEDMDDAERESILEVKMTQLALVEVLEGPDEAVNASYELLTLFSRLFGSISVQPTLKVPTHAEPPKTSSTLRSIRGSIFGSKTDRSRPPTRQPSATTFSEKQPVNTPRPATAQTAASSAPAIHVTEENGQMTGPPRSRHGSASLRQRSQSGTRNSLKKRDRSSSRQRPASATSLSQQATVVDGEPFFTPTIEVGQDEFFVKQNQGPPSSFPRGKTLSSLNSYLSTNSKSSEQSDLSGETTHASPQILPLIHFSKEKERTHRTTILVKVWLTIAGFYRRADMFDDCKGAAAEAQKLVQGLESDSTRDPSASGSTKGTTWAERKGIEELWGDVFSELGLLSLARDAPYAARSDFESALTHWPDHPAATVGLSNILLDIFSEKLLPPPAIPALDKLVPCFDSTGPSLTSISVNGAAKALPSSPLGLLPSAPEPPSSIEERTTPRDPDAHLPAPYKATRLPLADRLAARDRAYTLLSGLTRLGSGWDYSDAWFALARAHEESGQPDKAKEVLWWCVELEEARGVRDWRCVGGGGYVV